MERKTTQVALRLSPSEYARAQQIAELTNASVSEVFRSLVRSAHVSVRAAIVEVDSHNHGATDSEAQRAAVAA